MATRKNLLGFLFTVLAVMEYGCRTDVQPHATTEENMARTTGSTFQNLLPFMKERQIGAFNWGFVSEKTQTIYPWDSWRQTYTAEPEPWFHNVLRRDGTAYSEAEVDLIKSLTGVR